jgi:hypothetical protein
MSENKSIAKRTKKAEGGKQLTLLRMYWGDFKESQKQAIVQAASALHDADIDTVKIRKFLKKNIPEEHRIQKPKRPPSAFISFSIAKRRELMEQNPNASFGDIAKMLGQEWKSMSSDEKGEYESLKAPKAPKAPKKSPKKATKKSPKKATKKSPKKATKKSPKKSSTKKRKMSEM